MRPPEDRVDAHLARVLGSCRETLPSGSSRTLSCIREGEERSLALRGRRLTRPSNFLYMILYIGGGHTAGFAVLAFVCLQ